MPVHQVKNSKGKVIGYRWGTTGKLYHGKDAKAKAAKQGRAIEASEHGTNSRKA